MDYMQFLEECRKVEDEDKVGKIKGNPPKAKVAAATVPPTREDELTKLLRYQQHQIDTLLGQVNKLVSAVKSTRASSRGGHYWWGKDAYSINMERRFKRTDVPLEPLPSLGPETLR